jgi:hypothetical protein
VSVGEVIAVGTVLISMGGLIAWINVLRDEVKGLREWRHDVGEKPGYAAFERLVITNQRLDDTNARVARLERRVFNGKRDVHDDR